MASMTVIRFIWFYFAPLEVVYVVLFDVEPAFANVAAVLLSDIRQCVKSWKCVVLYMYASLQDACCV